MLVTRALDALSGAAKGAPAAPRRARRSGTRSAPAPARPAPAPSAPPVARDPRSGAQTVEVDPHAVRDLSIRYAPDRDGAPDAGEIVWTWVPYAENDGRGKDRPVLVIAAHGADRAYAVKLTSKSHDGDREYVSIGSGPWDGQGRESWVDVDQLYSVHPDGMRREAAELDRERFARVAEELRRRYGWRA
jgi:hypothetical protein